jgi:adenosylhomocysteine nucleosidase
MILVVTPMVEEMRFFKQAYVDYGFAHHELTLGRLPVVQFPELGLVLARGGTGKAQFALQTQHLIDNPVKHALSSVDEQGWGLVICAGAAGSLVDELAVGDLVVATKTVEHDYDNRFSERPLPTFEGDPATLDQLRGLSASPGDYSVHFGPVASGDEDIVDIVRRGELQRATGALAVAWEGAGGARACAFSGLPFVEIRAVTDTADSHAPTDFGNNLEQGLRNIANLVKQVAEKR